MARRFATVVSHLAATWRVTDKLVLTPSFFYQKIDSADTSTYWPSLSQPGAEEFVAGNVIAQPLHDLMGIPALKAEYFFPATTLTSVTSFFHRYETTIDDITDFESVLWGPSPYPFLPGQNAYENNLTTQNNFNQELRLQSSDPNARLTWVIGAWYSRQRLFTSEPATDLFLPELVYLATGLSLQDFFGAGLTDGRYTLTSNIHSIDTETALFGQSTYDIGAGWKLTAGVRVSKVSFFYHDIEGGPVNGPVPVVSEGGQTEHPVTPKIAISDQYDDNNLFYISASKGFRGGGEQLAVPLGICGAALASIGLTTLPKTYNSDSLWSYEIGAKNKLADGRVQISSSLYYIDWNNIQQLVPLSACGYEFFSNLGKATSMGFDTQVQASVTDHLVAGISVAYDNAYFRQTITPGITAGSANLVSSGDKLSPYAPWTVIANAEYHYNWFDRYRGYTRGEFEFHSHQTGTTVRLDPTTISYDPSYGLPPTYTMTKVRTGVAFDNWDISLFVNNLFDSHPALVTGHDVPTSPLFYQQSFRPRTIGLTAVFRR